MSLIAVIMGCQTSDVRFEETKQLLDFGFAGFTLVCPQQEDVQAQLTPIPVTRGTQTQVQPQVDALPKAVVRKDEAEQLEVQVQPAEQLEAPIQQGDSVGSVRLVLEGETLAEEPLCAGQTVERMTYLRGVQALLRGLVKMCG